MTASLDIISKIAHIPVHLNLEKMRSVTVEVVRQMDEILSNVTKPDRNCKARALS